MKTADKPVLLKLTDDYADEFDVECFCIMSKQEWDQIVEGLKNEKEYFELYFGTNEWLRYNNGQELLNCITVTEIEPSESEVIRRLIGYQYGVASGHFDRLLEKYYKDEEA